MMATRSFKFTRADDQPVGPSDKAEKVAEELRQLRNSRKRSLTRGRGTPQLPSSSNAIHIVYDNEGKRKTKHPSKERRRGIQGELQDVYVTYTHKRCISL